VARLQKRAAGRIFASDTIKAESCNPIASNDDTIELSQKKCIAFLRLGFDRYVTGAARSAGASIELARANVTGAARFAGASIEPTR
jgi:hypothetical protein